MKKNVLFGIVFLILLCTACTPSFTFPQPLLLADTETEVLVNCYNSL